MTKYHSTVTIQKQLPIHHKAFQMVLHLYRSQVGDITCSPTQNWWWKQTDLSYLHLPNQFNFTGCGLVTYWLFSLMASTVLNAKNSSLNPGLHNVAFHNKFFYNIFLKWEELWLFVSSIRCNYYSLQFCLLFFFLMLSVVMAKLHLQVLFFKGMSGISRNDLSSYFDTLTDLLQC